MCTAIMQHGRCKSCMTDTCLRVVGTRAASNHPANALCRRMGRLKAARRFQGADMYCWRASHTHVPSPEHVLQCSGSPLLNSRRSAADWLGHHPPPVCTNSVPTGILHGFWGHTMRVACVRTTPCGIPARLRRGTLHVRSEPPARVCASLHRCDQPLNATPAPPAAGEAAQVASAPAGAAAGDLPAALQLRLQFGVKNIPHPNKAHYGGEDAFFVSELGGGAAGIADGVGGWQESGINPADYSKSFMATARQYLEVSGHPRRTGLCCDVSGQAGRQAGSPSASPALCSRSLPPRRPHRAAAGPVPRAGVRQPVP